MAQADGSLIARDVATSTDIFKVTGDAAAGTYRVTMLQTLDARAVAAIRDFTP